MSDAPSDNESQSFKRNYAGTRVTKGQEDGNKIIESGQESGHDNDDPVENLRRFWRCIRNPKNSSAIQAVFTIVIALTGICYTYFSYRQLDEIRKSDKAAHEESRPWIGLTVDSIPTESKCAAGNAPKLDAMSVKGKLWNYGKSPAIRVAAEFAARSELVEMQSKFAEDPYEMSHFQSICSAAEDRINRKEARDSAFPGSRDYAVDVEKNSLGGFKADYRVLIGCIAYQDVDQKTIYHTRVRYNMSIPGQCGSYDANSTLLYLQAQEIETRP